MKVLKHWHGVLRPGLLPPGEGLSLQAAAHLVQLSLVVGKSLQQNYQLLSQLLGALEE